MDAGRTYDELLNENRELRYQLEEATDTIQAIRTGQVDALIVQEGNGHQLYTLKTADQTYRVFIEKMSEGAVTIDHDNTILYCNSSFARLVKMPLEKVIGLKFDIFIAPPSKELFDALIAKSWTEDSKEEILMDGPNTDRNTFCLVSCNTLDLDEGTALSLIITDLTRQKATEVQLQQKNEQLAEARNATEELNNELEATVIERTKELTLSREHLKVLADNLPQMTWTNTPGGDVNFFNRRWYDYTGLSLEEISKWKWEGLIHPDDQAGTMDKFNAALQNGDVFEVENRYRRSDGIYRWHLNRALPLRNDAGEIMFWVGTATDIEDQKQAMNKRDEFIGIASHENAFNQLKGLLAVDS